MLWMSSHKSKKILWSLAGGKIDSKACALRIREHAKEIDYLLGKTDNPKIPEPEPSQQDVRIKDVCNLLYTLSDEELCAVQAFVCGIIAGRT